MLFGFGRVSFFSKIAEYLEYLNETALIRLGLGFLILLFASFGKLFE